MRPSGNAAARETIVESGFVRFLPSQGRARAVAALRLIALAGLVIAAVLTPGFMSKTNLLSLITAASLTGCVALAMTFITLSGNVMSFCLGATLSVTTIVFVACLPAGLPMALAVAFVFSAALTGLQGLIIGYFRANPIIVSMATLAMIYGFVTLLTGGRGIYPEGSEADLLKGRVGEIPIPVIAFLLALAIGQFVLFRTRFGRNVMMVGSNQRVARAAGIGTWRTVTGAYIAAGILTAVSAVLMAARYASGDMEHGIGLDYQAISAVIVGGNAIEGGRGSLLHTTLGIATVAVLQGLLLLWGFSTAYQALAVGIAVLIIIMLQTLARSR